MIKGDWMLGKMLSKSREIAFWALDDVKGKIIREAYDEIKRIDHLNSTSEQVWEFQKKQ